MQGFLTRALLHGHGPMALPPHLRRGPNMVAIGTGVISPSSMPMGHQLAVAMSANTMQRYHWMAND